MLEAMDLLMSFPHTELTLKADRKTIPITALDITEENVEKFNTIYLWVKAKNWGKIVRTKSGSISIAKKNFKPPCWDVQLTSSCVELTILCIKGMWRIQFRQAPQTDTDKQRHIYGSEAFRWFTKRLRQDGVDLTEYAIDNGAEVKETIPKALVSVARRNIENIEFEHVYHVDYHSSHMAGLANTHPEFRPTVEYFYNNRKERPEYKAVLTNTWGYLQSLGCCQARWAHLSKDAIEDTNRRVSELAERVRAAGGMVLLFNTDGFWYVRQSGPYHGEGEGTALGEWQNDHFDCKFRIKSPGAYEYIEDGKYHAVVRGQTKLDKKLPRELWEWGSIFTNEASAVLAYYWSEEHGLIIKEA